MKVTFLLKIVKTFDANIGITGNFVLIAKHSTEAINDYPWHQFEDMWGAYHPLLWFPWG